MTDRDPYTPRFDPETPIDYYSVPNDDDRYVNVQQESKVSDPFDSVWDKPSKNSVLAGVGILVCIAFFGIITVTFLGVMVYNNTNGLGDSQLAFMTNLRDNTVKASACAEVYRQKLICQYIFSQLEPHLGFAVNCDIDTIPGVLPGFCPEELKLFSTTVEGTDFESVIGDTSKSFSSIFNSVNSNAKDSPSPSSSDYDDDDDDTSSSST